MHGWHRATVGTHTAGRQRTVWMWSGSAEPGYAGSGTRPASMLATSCCRCQAQTLFARKVAHKKGLIHQPTSLATVCDLDKMCVDPIGSQSATMTVAPD